MLVRPTRFHGRRQQTTNGDHRLPMLLVHRNVRPPALLAGWSTQLLEVRNAEHLDGVAAHQLVHNFITEVVGLLCGNLGGVWPR